MKKTLLTIAALALCGTAFGDPITYKTSEFKGDFIGEEDEGDYYVYVATQIIVDSSDSTGESGYASQNFYGRPTAIVFDGANIWNSQCNVLFGSSVALNITSTASAAQNWIDALTASPDGQITLFHIDSSNNFAQFGFNSKPLLEGVEKNGEITLNGTTDTLTATYMGYSSSTISLQDGQIALLKDGKDYKLVGKNLKSSPATPEPATATLSLLALAGLATRRRRK